MVNVRPKIADKEGWHISLAALVNSEVDEVGVRCLALLLRAAF